MLTAISVRKFKVLSSQGNCVVAGHPPSPSPLLFLFSFGLFFRCVSSSAYMCMCGFFSVNEIGEGPSLLFCVYEMKEKKRKKMPGCNRRRRREGRRRRRERDTNNKIPPGHIDPFGLFSRPFFSSYTFLFHFETKKILPVLEGEGGK